jgi:hypothetical protein
MKIFRFSLYSALHPVPPPPTLRKEVDENYIGKCKKYYKMRMPRKIQNYLYL